MITAIINNSALKAVGNCIKRAFLFFPRYVESDRNERGISPCLTAFLPLCVFSTQVKTSKGPADKWRLSARPSCNISLRERLCSQSQSVIFHLSHPYNSLGHCV